MKKTIITAYEVDGREVKEIKLIKVTGLYKKPVYHVNNSDYASSYFASDLQDNELFLRKEDAIKYIHRWESKNLELIKKAKAFSDFCKKNDLANPFIGIGEVNVSLRNVDAIKEITDPILRHFIEYHFPFRTYLSDVQKEIKRLINE